MAVAAAVAMVTALLPGSVLMPAAATAQDVILGGEVAVWHFEPDDYQPETDATLDAIQGLPARLGAAVGDDLDDPIPAAGRFGGGYDFDATPGGPSRGDWMDAGTPDILRLTGSASAMAWVFPKPSPAPRFYYILSNAQSSGGGYSLALTADLRPAAFIGPGFLHEASRPLPAGVWSHIGWTHDGVDLRFYVNGVLDTVIPQPASIQAGVGPMRLGADAGTAGPPDARAHAVLDEIRIYDRALDALEVARILDDVAPTTSASLSGTRGDEGWWRSAVTAELICEDDLSGCASTEYRVDEGPTQNYNGPFVVGGESDHTVTLRSKDRAENVEEWQSTSFRIDSIPPSTTATVLGTPGTDGWWRSDVTVELACSDATSGCTSSSMSVDAGPEQSYSEPFTVMGDGIHSVAHFSQDVAGNIEPPRLVEIKIDTTPPDVRLVEPVKGEAYVNDEPIGLRPPLPVTLIVGDKTLLAEASDGMSGVDRVEFLVDGVVRFSDRDAPYEFTWPASADSAGEHTLQLRAFDIAGNNAGTPQLTVTNVPTTLAGAHATLRAACRNAGLPEGLCAGLPQPLADPEPGNTCREFLNSATCDPIEDALHPQPPKLWEACRSVFSEGLCGQFFEP